MKTNTNHPDPYILYIVAAVLMIPAAAKLNIGTKPMFSMMMILDKPLNPDKTMMMLSLSSKL